MLHFPDRKKMGRKKNIRRLSVITVLIFIIFANTMSTNLMVYAEEQTETQAADQTEVLDVESPSCILVEAQVRCYLKKTVMKPWLRLRLQRL